jgi:hypothetical protein
MPGKREEETEKEGRYRKVLKIWAVSQCGTDE